MFCCCNPFSRKRRTQLSSQLFALKVLSSQLSTGSFALKVLKSSRASKAIRPPLEPLLSDRGSVASKSQVASTSCRRKSNCPILQLCNWATPKIEPQQDLVDSAPLVQSMQTGGSSLKI